MARAYSQDLRDRVIDAALAGLPARRAAVQFKVGIATAIGWVSRARRSGERVARRQGQPRRSKLDPRLIPIAPSCSGSSKRHRTSPLLRCRSDMQERLAAERGIQASVGTVWTFLDRCGLTVKKSPPMRPSRSDRTFWSSARRGSRASLISTRPSWSSSTRQRHPPTWPACAAAPRRANGCAPAFRKGTGKRHPLWRAYGLPA